MKKVFSLLCGILFLGAAQAQIIHVPGDRSTIQQGIDAASPGDTVLVENGTYYEQINFLGKKITVASRYLLDGNPNHIDSTIIDGSQITNQDHGSIVYFISGEDTTSILCGFTIRNGTKGTLEGGPSSFGITGGGIFISGCGAKIIHNHVTENHISDVALPGTVVVTWGGGIQTSEPSEDHWVVIQHNVIDHNSTTSGKLQAGAGGIAVNCNGIITNNIITDNTTTGINGASATSGGLACTNPPELNLHVSAIVKQNVISYNQVNADASWAGGAGAFFEANLSIISENIFENNVAYGSLYGFGSGVWLNYPYEGTIVSGNRFIGNNANGTGGGIDIEPYTNPVPVTVLVENNYFINNIATDGGGFHSYNIPVVLHNNVFQGNQAFNNGGAVCLDGYGNLTLPHLATLINNTISENIAEGYGGGIYTKYYNPLIINSILWNDGFSPQDNNEIFIEAGDIAEVAFTDVDADKIQGSWIDGGGLINDDPLFDVEPPLITKNWSPCVETGISSYTCDCGLVFDAPDYDIRGISRPAGTEYDMGAYDLEGWGIGIQRMTSFGLPVTNSPNPFTYATTFNYTLPAGSNVVIRIFDGFGRLVAEPVNTWQEQGKQRVTWYAGTVTPGMYYYRIESDSKVGTGKMVKY